MICSIGKIDFNCLTHSQWKAHMNLTLSYGHLTLPTTLVSLFQCSSGQNYVYIMQGFSSFYMKHLTWSQPSSVVLCLRNRVFQEEDANFPILTHLLYRCKTKFCASPGYKGRQIHIRVHQWNFMKGHWKLIQGLGTSQIPSTYSSNDYHEFFVASEFLDN